MPRSLSLAGGHRRGGTRARFACGRCQRRYPRLPSGREAHPRGGRGSARRRACPATEVLPLYARLSAADQARIFQKHSQRRVILATNVAETSLTVPGIRHVVDSGLARISRYSVRGKVQRLHVERISQASAEQRKGRCGREAEGICIRLYSEEDFAAREEYHTAGDPAHQSGQRDPAHGDARAGRSGELSVSRSAGHAPHQRRRAAARGVAGHGWRAPRDAPRPPDRRAAGRSTARPHAAGRRASALPGGDAGHRGVPRDAGSARAPDRIAAAGGREARAVRGSAAPISSRC